MTAAGISIVLRTASRRGWHALLIALVLLTVPSQVLAHGGEGVAGGFIAGFSHPLSGPDHMLAMISVGLWGAFLGRPLILALPMIFPGFMALGAALGMYGLPVPPIESGIALSVLTLGLMILFKVRAPVLLACAIVAAFGLFHGYAHGIELPSMADPVGYTAGFVICTGMLHLCGIALGLLKSLPAGMLALRGAGGAIALTGLVFVGRIIAA